MAVLAATATAAAGNLQELLPGTPTALVWAAKAATYVLLLLGALTGAAALYRYGPDRDRAKWTWITPGTIFAAVASLVLTLGFGFYVSRFGNYNKTYGSLATIVILVTWIWLTAFVFLFGAELNSELEHQTEKDTTAGAERPLGTRGAWSADHVASSDEPTKRATATSVLRKASLLTPPQPLALPPRLQPMDLHLLANMRLRALPTAWSASPVYRRSA